jgi:cobalt/nickel transport system permease protein
MGVTAAFVFAAQAINFPVAAGTSGHLVGGVLAAVLVGPSAAVVVMTAVLATQCLVFGDGGLLALGANVLNMAVIHPVFGFALVRAMLVGSGGMADASPVRRVASLAFASWAATVLAAATCAGELCLSGVAAPSVLLPAMVGIHAVIGLGEALIAALVLSAILRLRPEMLAVRPLREGGGAGSIVALGLSASLGPALFLSPFASKWPDALERVVDRFGVEPGRAYAGAAPLRDYHLPGAQASAGSTALVVAAGTFVVFGVAWAVGWWLRPRPGAPRPRAGDAPSRS